MTDIIENRENIDKAEEKETLRRIMFDRALNIVRSVPHIPLSFIGSDGLWLGPIESDALTETLHSLRELCGDYKLTRYFADHFGSLVAVYTFEHFTDDLVISFTKETSQDALDRLGKGRCKIQTTTKTETDFDVICDL